MSFKSWLRMRARNAPKPTQSWKARRCRPYLEALEDRTLLDAALANIVDARLLALQQGVGTLANTTAELPVLNSPLQSVAGEAQAALNQFRSALKPILTSLNASATETALRDYLYPRLEASGFLRDGNGNGIADDRVLTRNSATGEVRITVNVGKEILSGQSFTLGLGLPGIPLSISQGRLQVTAGFGYNQLTFGIRPDGQPFIDSSGQLQATVKAGPAPGAGIRGTLGFLTVKATNVSTNLNAAVSADVTPAGLVNPRLSGAADVNVKLEASLTATNLETDPQFGDIQYKYPGISTNFVMHWGFNQANPQAGRGALGDEPTVEFRDVQFAVGTYLSDVLRPIVSTVQEITEPFKPILDIISLEIPGLSDLSREAGLGPLSLKTLARFAGSIGAIPPDYKLLIDLVLTLDDLRQLVGDINTGGPLFVPVGSFNLTGNDIRNKVTLGLDSPNLTNLVPVAMGVVKSVESQLPRETKPIFDFINNTLKSAQNGAGFDFPLLRDPRSGVFKLLLGQDVDFANFTAQFHFDTSTTQLYPVFGTLSARLNGQLDADAYFKVGYDTYGLRRFLQTIVAGQPDGTQLANGLYFDSSRELLRLNGSISVGAALTIPLATVPVFIPLPFPPFTPVPIPIGPTFSVNGHLSAENVSVRFGGSQDKYRIFEATPYPLFLTQGLIKAGFNFVVEVGIPGIKMVSLYTKSLAETTLLDLDNGPLAAPVNPLTQPPTEPPGPREIPFDLNNYPQLTKNKTYKGFQLTTDATDISLVNGNVEFRINGTKVTAVRLNPGDSIKVIGTDDPDELTVDGSLNVPVRFIGGLGYNTVHLNDENTSVLLPTYTVTSTELKRTGMTGPTFSTVQLQFGGDVSAVSLTTSGKGAINSVNVNELPIGGADLNIFLGNAINNVGIKTVGGSFTNHVLIENKKGTGAANSVTLNDSADSASGTTYTIMEDRVVRQSPLDIQIKDGQIVRQYPTATTVEFHGIGAFNVRGGNNGGLFNVERTANNVQWRLFGGPGPDTFVVGAQYGRIGLVNGNVTIGGGGANDELILDNSGDDQATYNPQATFTLNGPQVDFHSQVQVDATFVVVDRRYTLGSIENLKIKAGGNTTFNVLDTPYDLIRPADTFKTTLIGGAKTNLANVYGTTSPVSLDGGVGGFAQVTIGSPTVGLDQINGAISIAGAGVNTLFVDDSASLLGHEFTVANNFVQRADKARISFENVFSLFLTTGVGRDSVSVLDTITGLGGTTVSAGAGGDDVIVTRTTGRLSVQAAAHSYVQIGTATSSLDNIRGSVLVLPPNVGPMTLALNDMAATAGQRLDITSGPAGTHYSRSGAADIRIDWLFPGADANALFRWIGGSGGNTVNVWSRPAASNSFDLGIGDDVFNLSTPAGTVSGLGAYVVDGIAGTDTVYLNDRGETRARNYDVSVYLGHTAVFAPGTRVSVASVDTFDLAGGSGGNTVSVLGAVPGTGATIHTGTGHNLVNIGQSGGPSQVSAGNQTHVSVLGEQGNDQFAMHSALANVALSLDGGGGVNTLDYSDFPSVSTAMHLTLSSITSRYKAEGNAVDNVSGNNGTLVDVGFAPGKVGQSFAFERGVVRVPRAANLERETVSVEAWVNSPPAPANKYLLAKGAQGDVAASYALYTGPDGGLRFGVYAHGSIFFNPFPVLLETPDCGRNIWDGSWHHVVGTFDGETAKLYVDGEFVRANSFSSPGFQIQYNLSTSNDLFIGAYPGPNDPHLYSGLIDEAAIYTRALSPVDIQALFAAANRPERGVTVNLPLGAATAVARGISNIHNVIGSASNDAIVGNGGNALDGGPGRDLLIAGVGADSLNGGLGEDILIAGTTDHDADTGTLDVIMTEWSRLDLGYADRVGHLLQGGGINGATVLNLDTVLRNAGPNTLTGGADLDLYYGSKTSDSHDWTVSSGQVFVDSDAVVAGRFAQYHAEENAADAIGDHDGVLVNGVAFAPGQVGRAFSFDGVDDYVDLGDDLQLSGDLTFAAWVRIDTLTSQAYLIADFDTTGWVSQGSLGIFQDRLHWYQSTTAGHRQGFVGATTLVTNVWYHVAAVRDDAAKTLTLYVNGVEDGRFSYTGTMVALQETRVLGGARPDSFPTDFFHGLIDEVSIYKVALSADQIQTVDRLAVAAQLDRAFAFYAPDNLFENHFGGGEKWLRDLAAHWYFILPNGELYRWDNLSSLTGELLATLDPSFHQDILKLVNAQFLFIGGLDQDPFGALAAQLDRDLNLNASDELFFNYGGSNERWLLSGTSPTTAWYFILPNGELYRWDGTADAATGQLAATLDSSFYHDLSKLVDAQYLFGT